MFNSITRRIRSRIIRYHKAHAMGININGGQYIPLFEDKWLLTSLLRGSGFPVVRDIARIPCKQDEMGSSGSFIGRLQEGIKNLPPGAYVIKPISGNQGRGIHLIVKDGQGLRFDHASLDADRAADAIARDMQEYNFHDSCIIQERVIQHESLDRFCNTALNTLRVLTVRRHNKVSLFDAVLKLARVGSVKNNMHAGAIAVRVDVESNKIASRGCRLLDESWHDSHPDTGITFVGRTLPWREELADILVGAHELFPEIKTIGWDVALTPDGPVIIEANLAWDASGHAVLFPGDFRKELLQALCSRQMGKA